MNYTSTVQIEFQPLDHDGAGPQDYTPLHRQTWVVCVRAAGTETLDVVSLKSWMRLWGRIGAELHRCFRNGDHFVRRDMITLAQEVGSLAGRVLADRLARWNIELACTTTNGSRRDVMIA